MKLEAGHEWLAGRPNPLGVHSCAGIYAELIESTT